MPLFLVLLLTTSYNPSVLTVPETTPQEIWMSKLADCESGASTTMRTWDTNNRWSIGKYQYQFSTWAKYSVRFGTTRENITDGDLQDKVTRYILDTKGWQDWVTCGAKTVKKLGAYPVSSD